ncbi:hypothetical protein FOB63_003850 [Clavispora lusitaniae]|uniref:Uncharacterized protein n=2 Tax=Clavispora lusitaniae TaxID=36911 RepID=C4YAV5_CLAL4|nr:uncharacterized protein CLUG_05420 [Clavispora lusitaniae ATCC 42720]EEQ41292.1 hypothetical protein CLUG_05420 [Clavispora lusitaniae ATCC 42720]KAF7581213.1 hypothetical protein FOB63_003850 [Clavispora lusitaniae]
MIDRFPVEIQVRILRLVPESALKQTSSHFYLLYNDLFYDKLIRTFGDDVVHILSKVYPQLREYIISLDSFRLVSRQAISSRLNLIDHGDIRHPNPEQLIESMYVKDSWRYIFSLLKNKRLYAEYSDYKIDEPTNYIYNHYVEINRTYLLSYTKDIWLAPGMYNLNIGLVIKHGTGLGTTKFEVEYQTTGGAIEVQTFYPPTNINEILPKNQFCFLKIGEFHLPQVRHKLNGRNCPSHNNRLFKVKLIMEEIGLYLKSGFSIFYIDISQPSTLLNEYDLLFYSCQETDYKYYINFPLKNFYKVLNYVQNPSEEDGISEYESYGKGNPDNILSTLDNDFIDTPRDESDSDHQLLDYSSFFYLNKSNHRTYRFNTVYQKRQFINRFGNFDPIDSEPNTCSYDKEDLKWRIPILGEL